MCRSESGDVFRSSQEGRQAAPGRTHENVSDTHHVWQKTIRVTKSTRQSSMQNPAYHRVAPSQLNTCQHNMPQTHKKTHPTRHTNTTPDEKVDDASARPQKHEGVDCKRQRLPKPVKGVVCCCAHVPAVGGGAIEPHDCDSNDACCWLPKCKLLTAPTCVTVRCWLKAMHRRQAKTACSVVCVLLKLAQAGCGC